MIDKIAMNAFIQKRWDQLWAEGKHGHYETLFRVVYDAIEIAPRFEMYQEPSDASPQSQG